MSQLPSSFDNSNVEYAEEMPFWDKVAFHCKQQPLVPLGCALTTIAVILAAKNIKSGDKRRAQYWFRWRVGLQGATLVVLVAGSFLYGKNSQERKTQDELMKDKAKMRERLWIQELERRDEEMKARKKRAELARIKAQEMENETSKIQEELKKLEKEIQEGSNNKN
ncbi:respiratory supercomplex assembly factor RCF1 SCDLUD_004932 [Saccharomycodes ludwigii]|uniref:respiratory supercomplex assembly factor RCF1 n=1 Tax=Saccharomycodes ludwigii TaxID=36035 RepID=UPI001E850180|nr:hypothetical protein SCDLUD_004932 [Saccharomycodes ludwigii]KAH3899487.1 hypothetical protein SCDLUD_004932 [Saccharomycodes ludwigii]